jgi:hypothetical protein
MFMIYQSSTLHRNNQGTAATVYICLQKKQTTKGCVVFLQESIPLGKCSDCLATSVVVAPQACSSFCDRYVSLHSTFEQKDKGVACCVHNEFWTSKTTHLFIISTL